MQDIEIVACSGIFAVGTDGLVHQCLLTVDKGFLDYNQNDDR